jgi:hypothetical protein
VPARIMAGTRSALCPPYDREWPLRTLRRRYNAGALPKF